MTSVAICAAEITRDQDQTSAPVRCCDGATGDLGNCARLDLAAGAVCLLDPCWPPCGLYGGLGPTISFNRYFDDSYDYRLRSTDAMEDTIGGVDALLFPIAAPEGQAVFDPDNPGADPPVFRLAQGSAGSHIVGLAQ